MAIDFGSLLMPTRGLSPINLAMPKDDSIEKQHMQLMREEFENTKKHQQEQQQLEQMAEQGRMAREQMTQQRLREQEAATQAAEVKKQKVETLKKFGELNASGDIEGARAMVPAMTAMGMAVDLQGEVNGLPRYRINLSPEERAAEDAQTAQQGIGYPTNDTAPMVPENIRGSTEAAFRLAQKASQQAEETGEPAKGPDEPDYTGAVPNNVIDVGAIQAQTAARLNPALSGLVASYPKEYQESAQKTADAVKSLGLPAAKAVKEYQSARESPDSLIKAQIAAEATSGQNTQANARLQANSAEEHFHNGWGYAKEAADKYELQKIKERNKAVSQVRDILNNSDTSDDYLAGTAMARLMGEKGNLAEGDIKRALGTSAVSFLDRLSAGAYREAFGGLSDQQKHALLGLAKKSEDLDREQTYQFLDSIEEQSNSPAVDRDVARGLRSYRDTVVDSPTREAHRLARHPEQAKPAAEQPQGFNMEQDSKTAPYQTSVGMTAEDQGGGDVSIPKSSRIAYEHNNPGNLKFADQEGATKGESASDGGNFAKFASVDDGLKALRKQVERDAEAGMTVEDFITKYAPPGSNDTKTYIEQALAALHAKRGDALAETDPYDVVRFIAKKESGTELPDQYAKKGAPVADVDAALQRSGY